MEALKMMWEEWTKALQDWLWELRADTPRAVMVGVTTCGIIIVSLFFIYSVSSIKPEQALTPLERNTNQLSQLLSIAEKQNELLGQTVDRMLILENDVRELKGGAQ